MNCLKLTILLVCLIGAKALPTSNLAQSKLDSTLANYLMQSNTLDLVVDPSVPEQCFNLYLPILSEVADTFSTQYQACTTVANEQIANLTEQADETKNAFNVEASDICTAYQSCANESDILSSFSCYASVSSKEVTVVYGISSSANTAANTYTNGLKTIQNDQDLCTNTTEQTYVDNTAATYELLDACLKNGPPTTVAPTTSEPTTTKPTTSAPTTVPPTTSVPTTVFVPAAPVETTADSSNSGVTTEATPAIQAEFQCSGTDCSNVSSLKLNLLKIN